MVTQAGGWGQLEGLQMAGWPDTSTERKQIWKVQRLRELCGASWNWGAWMVHSYTEMVTEV